MGADETPLEFVITDTPPDNAPETEALTSASPYEYSCEVCGAELIYAGRGRKPKRCEVHRKAAPAGVRKTTTGRGWQEPLAAALMQQFTFIGVGIYAVNQFDGQCVIQGSPQLATSLVGVAESNQRVRQALESFVTAGAWAGVASAVAAIMIPILQNHRVIPPFNLPGMVQPNV